MLPIQVIRPSKEKLGATEYKIWRRHRDDRRLQHIISTLNERELFSRCYDYKASALQHGWVWIQLPWIRLPQRKGNLKVKTVFEARPTNLRHDDYLQLTGGYMIRNLDGQTQLAWIEEFIESQRMFWDEMNIYEFGGTIEPEVDCLQPLIGFGGRFASRTTAKKGVALYINRIITYADLAPEYFYLLYDREGELLRNIRKYNMNLQVEWEKQIEGCKAGRISLDGSIEGRQVKSGGVFYEIGRYTKDAELMYAKNFAENQKPQTQLYEDTELFLYAVEQRIDEKFNIAKYTHEFNLESECECEKNSLGHPSVFEGGGLGPNTTYMFWDPGSHQYVRADDFCTGKLLWHFDTWPHHGSGDFELLSDSFFHIERRGPVGEELHAIYYTYEGSLKEDIQIEDPEELRNYEFKQYKSLADDTILAIRKQQGGEQKYLVHYTKTFQIINMIQLSGPYEQFYPSLVVQYRYIA